MPFPPLPAQATASLPDSSVTWIQPVLPTWLLPAHSPCWHTATHSLLPAPSGSCDCSHEVQWQGFGAACCHRQQEEYLRVQLRCWHGFTQHSLGEWSCTVLRLFLVLARPVKQCSSFVFPRKVHATICVRWGKGFCTPVLAAPPAQHGYGLQTSLLACTLWLWPYGYSCATGRQRGVWPEQRSSKSSLTWQMKKERLKGDVTNTSTSPLDWWWQSMLSRGFAR